MITATYRGRIADESKFRALLHKGGVDVRYLDERARVRVVAVPTVQPRHYEITLTRGEKRTRAKRPTLAELDELAIGRPWVPA